MKIRLTQISSKPLFALIVGSVLVAVPLLLTWNYLFHDFIYDDSYIAFRFSENWATGNGLTWNPGEDPVEGFTSFTWAFLGAFLQRIFGTPPHIVMPFIGIASWLFLMTLVLPLTTKIVLSRQSSASISSGLLGIFTVLVLALNASLGFHAFHGLETALHTLIFVLLAYLSLNTVTLRGAVTLSLVSLVSVMTRPDALAFVFPLWGVYFIYGASRSKRYKAAVGFSVFVIALGAYSIVKWQYFGYLFPNTFYIKQGGLLELLHNRA